MKHGTKNSGTMMRRMAVAMTMMTVGYAAAYSGANTAVLPFESSCTGFSRTGVITSEVFNSFGASIAEMMTISLTKKGVSVVDRSYLKKLIEEQVLTNTGAFDETSAPQIGRLLGAKLMVVGNITTCSFDKKDTSLGLGLSWKLTAKIGMTVKVLETETGKIVATYQGEVSKSKNETTITLNGVQDLVDLSKGKRRRMPVRNDGTVAWGTIPCMSDAMAEIAEKASTEIAEKCKSAGVSEMEGKVFGVPSSDEFIANFGTNHGLQVGDKVEVKLVTKTYSDGTTTYNETTVIGTGTVTSVQNASVKIRIDRTNSTAMKETDVVYVKIAKA